MDGSAYSVDSVDKVDKVDGVDVADRVDGDNVNYSVVLFVNDHMKKMRN